MKVAAKKQKDYYDEKASMVQYKSGDSVWCLSEQRKVGRGPKLQPIYEGPYVVIQILRELSYRIQKIKDGHKSVTKQSKIV